MGAWGGVGRWGMGRGGWGGLISPGRGTQWGRGTEWGREVREDNKVKEISKASNLYGSF